MFASLMSVINHPENKNHKVKTILRIVWWKFNQLLFKLPTIVQLTKDIKCVCYPNSSYASLIIYNRLPEYAEMNYLLKVLGSKSNFVDVGSGLGDFSLLAASKIQTGKIYAFEPTQSALSQLHDNVNLNNLKDKIFIIPKIVSDKDGFEFFSDLPVTEENTITSQSNHSKKIISTKLDSFFDNKINIDLLKIDVEGAELKALHGAERMLENKQIKKMLIELNPKCQTFGYTRQDVLDCLLAHKYKLFTFDHQGKTLRFSKAQELTPLTVNILATI